MITHCFPSLVFIQKHAGRVNSLMDKPLHAFSFQKSPSNCKHKINITLLMSENACVNVIEFLLSCIGCKM